MELPPELTRIPPQSLDVLRYMGQNGVTQGDAETLAEGTGMSDRSIKRAIRGLITAGYLHMDDSYIYYLTEKGVKAVEDLAAYDSAQPQPVMDLDGAKLVSERLVAVLPNPLGARETATLQLGFFQMPQVTVPTQVVLRLSASNGTISPPEITLDVQPNQKVEPGETYYTPTGQLGQIRIRIEALQITDMAEVHQAGGMFIDLEIAPAGGLPKAWHGLIELQS
jgi:DNA-binding MarR family transcriptional regulator